MCSNDKCREECLQAKEPRTHADRGFCHASQSPRSSLRATAASSNGRHLGIRFVRGI